MKRIFVPIIILVLLEGCMYTEPTAVFYNFKIINKTTSDLYLETQQNCQSEIYFDTLKQNNVHIDTNVNWCSSVCGDTLINFFFLKLNIKTNESTLKIDPYNLSNWTDSTDYKLGTSCSGGGTIYYTLIIKDSDLK